MSVCNVVCLCVSKVSFAKTAEMPFEVTEGEGADSHRSPGNHVLDRCTYRYHLGNIIE